jgi:hypothetical protein
MSGYRPPEWSQPALTTITLTTTASVTTSQVDDLTSGPTANQSAASTSNSTSSTLYVFDAVYRVLHSRRLRMTEHPVQSGASISDHAFLMPAKVSLEIGMSDAMDAYAPDVFTTNASKSVSAYEILVALQQGRQPLTLSTRLDTYTNMLIESIDAPDTKETRYGLKATVMLSQIFTGTVTSIPVSARPQTTDSTSIGAKQPLPISSGDLSRFMVTLPEDAPTVPGAGGVSSNGISRYLGTIPEFPVN